MKAVAAFLVVLYLAVSQAWDCTKGPRLYNIKQIDAGSGLVIGVSRYKRAYLLHGSSWYTMGSLSLVHATVGKAGMWAVDDSNKVYKMVAGNWQEAFGISLLQVDAGGPGHVVGITPKDYYSYCLRDYLACDYYGKGSMAWTGLSLQLHYISCGKYGCWGVDKNSQTYATQIRSSATCTPSKWTLVAGPKMSMIEVSSDGSVFGLSTDGKVWQRTGITASLKTGKKWEYIPMCMPISHLTYDLHHLWVVTKTGWLLKCTH